MENTGDCRLLRAGGFFARWTARPCGTLHTPRSLELVQQLVQRRPRGESNAQPLERFWPTWSVARTHSDREARGSANARRACGRRGHSENLQDRAAATFAARTTFSRAVARFADDATASSSRLASAALAPRSLPKQAHDLPCTASRLHLRTLSNPSWGTRILSHELVHDLGRGSTRQLIQALPEEWWL